MHSRNIILPPAEMWGMNYSVGSCIAAAGEEQVVRLKSELDLIIYSKISGEMRQSQHLKYFVVQMRLPFGLFAVS